MSNEPRYVVIDTESSDLFRYKDEAGNSVAADAEGQPRLASIAMLFLAPDLTLEREYHTFVQPVGWEMSAGATAVNGLTTEFLRANGRPVAEPLEEYRKAIEIDKRVLVAHNVVHDAKQMRAELRRASLPDLFEETKTICTMRSLMGVVVKPGGKKGWPKLSECCEHFGIQSRGDHTAQRDAHDVFALLLRMRDLGLLRDGQVNYAKRGYMKKAAASAAEYF